MESDQLGEIVIKNRSVQLIDSVIEIKEREAVLDLALKTLIDGEVGDYH